MADEYNYSSGTAIPSESLKVETTTSGSTLPGKVGFEGLWQKGWQSVTSGSPINNTSIVSVTSTEANTDVQATMPKIKRVKRDFRFYKRG